MVIDGLEDLIGLRDQRAREIATHLETVLHLGPAHGVYAILAVRSADNRFDEVLNTIAQLPLEALGTRLVFDCHEQVASRVAEEGVIERDGEETDLRPGEARQLDVGAVKVERPVRLTVTTERDRYRLYRAIHDLAVRKGISARPRIHDGTAPVRLELSPLHQLVVNPDSRDARRTPRMWLGEPSGLGDPVEALLRRQEGANLLMVTDRQEFGIGMILSALTSTLLVHGAGFEGRVLDFTPLDSGLTESVQTFAENWNVKLDRRRNTAKVLDRVHRTVQDRLASQRYDSPPTVLFIAGLERARDLEPGRHVPGEPELAEVLAAILRDGPDVGVHVVAWSSTVDALNRRLGIGAQREFSLRVATKLDEEASDELLDGDSAVGLHANQAVMHDEDWGRVVVFRPFVPPPVSWLAGLAAAAAGRPGR